MKHEIDRRQDPRAPISLPVKIKTPKGTIQGKTANISISGLALLIFTESPDVGDEFQITLALSDQHEAEVTCEKRWFGDLVAGDTVYTAIGVQFIKISPRDQEIIADLVKEYCMA